MSTKYPSEDYHGVNTVAKLARVLKRVRACVFCLACWKQARKTRWTDRRQKKKWNKQKTWKRINHFCWHCDNCTIETSSNEWWNFCRALRQKKHEEWVQARMCEIKEKVLRSLASADMRARSCFFANFPKEKNKLPRKYYIETATCSIFLTRGYLQLL